jgi:hypothetical protein
MLLKGQGWNICRGLEECWSFGVHLWEVRIHGFSNSWNVSFSDLAWAWFHLKDASQKDMRLFWRVVNVNSTCWSFVHEPDYFITWWTNESSRWIFYYRRLLLLFPAGAGCQSILMWRHCADCSVTEMVNSWWPGIDLLQSCSSLGVWSTGFGPSYLLANVKVSGAWASLEAQNVGQIWVLILLHYWGSLLSNFVVLLLLWWVIRN